MRVASAHHVISQAARLAVAVAIACTLGACAAVKDRIGQTGEPGVTTQIPQPAPSPSSSQATQPAPSATAAPATPAAPAATTARAKAAAARPARGLSLRSECTARDETGYTESIRLAVDQGKVGMLEAKIDIPRRGSCGFRLADFRQTRTEPHVELKSSNGSMCTVRMWQQGERFTVSFSDCQEKCTRGAFDYVWPVELNSADGSCL